jgi:hypothetical protein
VNKYLIYLFIIVLPCLSFTQVVHKWKIIDKETNNVIKNAKCFVNDVKIQPDTNFTFSIEDSQLPTSNYVLTIACENYKSLLFRYTSLSEFDSIYSLSLSSKKFKEIIIKRTFKNNLGNLQLSQDQIKKIPKFLGENDVIKAIQLLPGIQSSGDGNGIYVRGGGIDQNLISYDDISLYNISHLFGFFSVFNSNAISKVDIYKSGIPANFGGRVSSVINIQSQTGNFQKWKGEVGIGLLAANISIDGPIKKDTSSLLFAARRTYVDYFNKSISSNSNYQSDYYFYDLNFKYYHKLNSRNTLTISGLTGKDDFIYNEILNNSFSNNINWQTKLISSKWKSILNDKLTTNTTLGFVNYSMSFGAGIYNYSLDLFSKINDFSFKNEWTLKHYNNAKLNFGTEIIHHQLSPNNFSIQGESNDKKLNNALKLNSMEYNLFVDETFQFNEKWKVNLGIRYSLFQQLGPFKRLIFNENSIVTDSIIYPTNSTIKIYQNPEPRLQLFYEKSEKSIFNLSYSTNYQYLHLAPVSSISLPTDVWVPSSSVIKPQQGNQISLGYSTSFIHDTLQFSTEIYYKHMVNLIEYKEGVASLISLQNNYDDNFFFGNGQSIGIEFLMKKNMGKWTGWIGYTFSESTRNFQEIENNRTFYAKNDRRHDVSTVLNYELNDKWSFSGVFVFKTGNALTIPLSRYILQGNVINTYSPKNSYRIPPYHRLDISCNYSIKKTSKTEQYLNFSIFNAYARQNPFYIYFETKGDISKFAIETKAKQVSLFTILPSISWRAVFK